MTDICLKKYTMRVKIRIRTVTSFSKTVLSVYQNISITPTLLATMHIFHNIVIYYHIVY